MACDELSRVEIRPTKMNVITVGRVSAPAEISFKFTGPWGDELAASRKERAEGIAAVPGLIWKIWTENSETGEGGVGQRDIFSGTGEISRYPQRAGRC